ncbi:MAG: glycosyltransferase [Bacteriovoracaceae bacterium]|nr:glycosyltransferase [Bacteriovoracaceae bacterium]
MLVSRSGYEINFKVDEEKLAKLLKLKAELGDNFPRFGVMVISYNAANFIETTLNRISPKLIDIIEEIFVFDDNSPDNTFEVVKNYAGTSPWKEKLNIFKNPRNLRYGGNQKVGYQYAIDRGLDYAIMLHGDGQYAPEYIVDLMLPAVEEKFDVVFASRMMRKKDAIKGGMPFYKFLGNQVLTKFENIILGTKLTEFHSGYRMYSTKILKKMPIKMNTDDFHFDTEIIIQCRHLGAPIKEVPIQTFYGDEECNVNGFQYAFDVCKSVILYRLHQLHIIRKGSYIVNREFIYKRKYSPYSSHEKILNMIPAGNGRVLCIGDSDGLLYESLIAKGYEVQIVDEREGHATFIPNNNYHQTLMKDVNELPFKREFEFVILCDVLARVVDPMDTLIKLKKFVKPDGRLITSVPNIAIWVYRLSLAIGRFNYAEGGPLDRKHLRFFTKFSAQQVLINSGYEVRELKPTGLPFEIVFSSSGKSKFLKFCDGLYFSLANIWHKLFAYQFVISAQITGVEEP